MQNRPGQQGSQTGTGTQLAQQDWNTYMQALANTNPTQRKQAIQSFVEYLKKENKLDQFIVSLEETGEIVERVQNSR